MVTVGNICPNSGRTSWRRPRGPTLAGMSKRSTILVSVNGPDHPGISAGLMDVLSAGGAEDLTSRLSIESRRQ